jgi:CRISPR-associated protein Cmr4
MKFKTFLIECITNLHVGSGDSNYGIVDNLVQRDSVTGHPTIHATSLKGALKKHFKNSQISNFDQIFGNDGKDSGNVKFLGADLVAIPVRCTFEGYVLGINKKLWDDINAKSSVLGNENILGNVTNSNSIFAAISGKIYAEEFELSPTSATLPSIPNYSSNTNFASFDMDIFSEITKRLPVIARNRLGEEDKNLWYEEFVPHKTLFVTYIGIEEENMDFISSLDGQLVQIGANSSVGYGLCKFTLISEQA